ncbi:DNA topoisomerase I [Stratiformator vulcanicus]|nr:DNA topoisomerase I [Stratiformator vulcanicus]
MSFARPILRPLVRIVVGLLAIPLFRLFLRRVVRLQELDAELEKDLEQWFRASLVLLCATANMEDLIFGWVPLNLQENYAWITVGLRLMLAIGVIESMPDQELFTIIHPGPSWRGFDWRRPFGSVKRSWRQLAKGLACQHLARSSPVFALLAAIYGGYPDVNDPEQYERMYDDWIVGWVCYTFAITQYLIIGLVTSRDKALDALAEFDRRIAERRAELVEEFDVREGGKERGARSREGRKRKAESGKPEAERVKPSEHRAPDS